jgi:pantetheine-phosphate adenylyltransferase
MTGSITKVTAVFPGTFNPPTNGHLQVIQDCAPLFAAVRVVVAYNPEKEDSSLFSAEERVAMFEEIAEPWKNVTVASLPSDRYMVDYVREVGASCMIRGMRTGIDLEDERDIGSVNRMRAPEIPTLYALTHGQTAGIRSSLVRAQLGLVEWEETVAHYVPEPVLGRLEAKVRERKGR